MSAETQARISITVMKFLFLVPFVQATSCPIFIYVHDYATLHNDDCKGASGEGRISRLPSRN
jgi:hypothetical protein